MIKVNNNSKVIKDRNFQQVIYALKENYPLTEINDEVAGSDYIITCK